jgi:hypothetical protein
MPTAKVIEQKPGALQFIRTIYLSLAAIIGLICFIMGASGAVKMVLNVWFPVDNFTYYSMPYEKSGCEFNFTTDGKQIPRPAGEVAKCEQETEKTRELQQKQQQTNDFNRQVSESVALTLVGFPVWLLHFWLIQLDWKKSRKNIA